MQPPFWHSSFSCCGTNFVQHLSVLSGNSCAAALEINFIVSNSIVKGLWSTVSDKFHHGESHPVLSSLCMLEAFQKNWQHFQKLPV